MSRNKYSVGDRIRIRETVSPNGKYAPDAGMQGSIIKCNWDRTDIKLDNGKTYMYVGWSVIEKVQAKSSDVTSIEKLERDLNNIRDSRNKLDEKIIELENKLMFVSQFDLDEYDETLHNAYQILNVCNPNQRDVPMNVQLQKAQAIAKILNKK